MKAKHLSLFIAACLLAGVISGCSPAASDKSDSNINSGETTSSSASEVQKFVRETIPAPSLSNNMLDEDTEQGIAVYLPPSYNTSEKQYPVVYFLHGFGNSYIAHANDFYNEMTTLLEQQKVNEMIIVTLNGTNKLGGSFYYNSPVTGNWEDFVTHDVVQYVDNHYRTIKSADKRGLVGHSMGGFGVLNIVMHTKDIFGYAYAMSPGIFDENGLSKSPVSFIMAQNIANRYTDMDESTAREEYLKLLPTLTWSRNLSVAYPSAFAPDPTAKPPYIKIPALDQNGVPEKDDIWQLYNAGYGDIPAKISQYQDNLMSLKGFTIEYGKYDGFNWIIDGCKYFSEQLNQKGIANQLVEFNGGHEDQVSTRFREAVLPYFSEMFDTP